MPQIEFGAAVCKVGDRGDILFGDGAGCVVGDEESHGVLQLHEVARPGVRHELRFGTLCDPDSAVVQDLVFVYAVIDIELYIVMSLTDGRHTKECRIEEHIETVDHDVHPHQFFR